MNSARACLSAMFLGPINIQSRPIESFSTEYCRLVEPMDPGRELGGSNISTAKAAFLPFARNCWTTSAICAMGIEYSSIGVMAIFHIKGGGGHSCFVKR